MKFLARIYQIHHVYIRYRYVDLLLWTIDLPIYRTCTHHRFPVRKTGQWTQISGRKNCQWTQISLEISGKLAIGRKFPWKFPEISFLTPRQISKGISGNVRSGQVPRPTTVYSVLSTTVVSYRYLATRSDATTARPRGPITSGHRGQTPW